MVFIRIEIQILQSYYTISANCILIQAFVMYILERKRKKKKTNMIYKWRNCFAVQFHQFNSIHYPLHIRYKILSIQINRVVRSRTIPILAKIIVSYKPPKRIDAPNNALVMLAFPSLVMNNSDNTKCWLYGGSKPRRNCLGGKLLNLLLSIWEK